MGVIKSYNANSIEPANVLQSMKLNTNTFNYTRFLHSY
uniref:Uncharacterized protein n=1 Tax=uncultured Desulfobacterium sp. TaxID=201089 RepID=E1YLT6_9BACT|nr:unknown protein [uncultured Desulfobacterium sp.]